MKLGGQGLLLAIVSAVVAVALVTGFLVLGSPGDARKQELDRKRIEDLRGLAVSLSPAGADSLPADLSIYDWGLRMKTSWDISDPVTHRPYGYRRLDRTHFDLCAIFETEVQIADLDQWERGWAHPRGVYCFRFDTRYAGVPQPPR